MFAFLCLAIMVVLGDVLSRRFYRWVSWPQRLATSFLVGTLVSSLFTYLLALAFARTSKPLLWANLVYFVMAATVIYWLQFRRPKQASTNFRSLTPSDWISLGLVFLFSCWLMFSTLNFRDGKFLLAFKGWSDFGANISLLQSFALANNFPTVHPFYSGELVRYHFIFWFQCANLSYLGLNPVWSVNVLSILSLVSLFVLIATAAELLFESRLVGKLAVVLFLFSSSLFYLPFVRTETIQTLMQRAVFLPSGYPWRGEDWGVLTISVLGYQRHLISGMGILLVVVIFLIEMYRNLEALEATKEKPVGTKLDTSLLYPSIFSGVLIGLLPFWNSPAFVASIAILGCVFLLLPLRIYTGSVLVTALALGVPQVFILRTRGSGQALFHWGYTLQDPTIFQVLKYLGWSFGFKWVLIGVALIFLRRWQRSLFFAFTSLVAVVFLFQLSVDNFNNHKLLNIWTIFAAMFAAYGLWRIAKIRIVGIGLAIVVGIAATLGGVIDLFPIQNDPKLVVPHNNDRLTTWVLENTNPSDLFLSQRWLSHPVLFAGRRLFLGNTLFAWTAGYDLGPREALYRKMFEERDPAKLIELLNENKIAFVAFDNGLRDSKLVQKLNEDIYEKTFEKVFTDDQRQYDQLSIFKVSSIKSANLSSASVVRMSAFVGGKGNGFGQFLRPRGIAFDRAGNFYVADSGNSRVVKFSPSGEFVAVIGDAGVLREPNGVALDSEDKLYVTDAGSHRLLKLNVEGGVEQEWTGPEPGFFGLRGITVGSNGEIYLVDQGRSRMVKLGSDGQMSQWGSRGDGDGQFLEPTAVAVTNDRVFVADAQNGRIQVFDTVGKFIAKWEVPEWKESIWQYPELFIDQKAQRLYATSTVTNEVLVFDFNGTMLSRIESTQANVLDGPAGLALRGGTLYVVNFNGSRVSRVPLQSSAR